MSNPKKIVYSILVIVFVVCGLVSIRSVRYLILSEKTSREIDIFLHFPSQEEKFLKASLLELSLDIKNGITITKFNAISEKIELNYQLSKPFLLEQQIVVTDKLIEKIITSRPILESCTKDDSCDFAKHHEELEALDIKFQDLLDIIILDTQAATNHAETLLNNIKLHLPPPPASSLPKSSLRDFILAKLYTSVYFDLSLTIREY